MGFTQIKARPLSMPIPWDSAQEPTARWMAAWPMDWAVERVSSMRFNSLLSLTIRDDGKQSLLITGREDSRLMRAILAIDPKPFAKFLLLACCYQEAPA
jgi:hypothetical protein